MPSATGREADACAVITDEAFEAVQRAAFSFAARQHIPSSASRIRSPRGRFSRRALGLSELSRGRLRSSGRRQSSSESQAWAKSGRATHTFATQLSVGSWPQRLKSLSTHGLPALEPSSTRLRSVGIRSAHAVLALPVLALVEACATRTCAATARETHRAVAVAASLARKAVFDAGLTPLGPWCAHAAQAVGALSEGLVVTAKRSLHAAVFAVQASLSHGWEGAAFGRVQGADHATGLVASVRENAPRNEAPMGPEVTVGAANRIPRSRAT